MIFPCFDEGILKEFQDSGKKGEGHFIGHMYTYKQISIYIFCFNYYCFIYFLIIIEYTQPTIHCTSKKHRQHQDPERTNKERMKNIPFDSPMEEGPPIVGAANQPIMKIR